MERQTHQYMHPNDQVLVRIWQNDHGKCVILDNTQLDEKPRWTWAGTLPLNPAEHVGEFFPSWRTVTFCVQWRQRGVTQWWRSRWTFTWNVWSRSALWIRRCQILWCQWFYTSGKRYRTSTSKQRTCMVSLSQRPEQEADEWWGFRTRYFFGCSS